MCLVLSCLPALLMVSLVQASEALSQAPQVISNMRQAWSPHEVLYLGPSPALAIGSKEGPMYEFNRVAGNFRLQNGSIVVADGGSATRSEQDPV